MQGINYALAAVYQGIRNRRPSGTPYFNLRVGISFLLFMHVIDFLAALRVFYNLDAVPGRSTFLYYFLSFCPLCFFALGYIIPENRLNDQEVPKGDITRYSWYAFIYWTCCTLSFAVLVTHFPPPDVKAGY